MSRTDHHRPYRIRAADPTNPLRYDVHWHGLDGDVPCNIENNRHPGFHGMGLFWRRLKWADRADCSWQMRGYSGHRYGRVQSRRGAWGPERAAERVWAGRARGGEWDAEPPDGRTRHGLLAEWW